MTKNFKKKIKLFFIETDGFFGSLLGMYPGQVAAIVYDYRQIGNIDRNRSSAAAIVYVGQLIN